MNRMGFGPALLGLGIALAALGSIDVVQAESGSQTNPDSALATTLASIRGTTLSLDDALARAWDHASDLRRAEFSVEAAEGAVRRERGSFDPELFGELRRAGEETPSASPFSGADVLDTEQSDLIAGSRIRLPLGTEVEATLRTTRSITNSSFAALDPQYETAGKIEVRQPLLRGFAPSARKGLTAAERNLDAARASLQSARLDLRATVISAYWDLYAAERDYAVQLLTLERAEAFLAETDLRVKAGLVGPSETASARLFLADQEQMVLDREERLDSASDRLATLIGIRPTAEAYRFRAVDTPPTAGAVRPVEELVAQARASNPSLTAVKHRVEATEALLRGAAWDLLPELELYGAVGGAGLAGDPQEVEFGGVAYRSRLDGGARDTWSQVFDGDFPSWTAGVEFSIPIGFRGGTGERNRLQAEVRIAEEDLRARELMIEEEVRVTHRQLAHGARRLSAARDGVAAAQEQVRIGLIEYRSGSATAFELVRLGADLATAQQRLSQAVVRTAKAEAQLQRLTGDDQTPVQEGDLQ